LPDILGGVQPDQHEGHALPAQRHPGVQGHRAHGAHHLHHRSGGDDVQRPGPAVLLHHLLGRPTRGRCGGEWWSDGLSVSSQSCLSPNQLGHLQHRPALRHPAVQTRLRRQNLHLPLAGGGSGESGVGPCGTCGDLVWLGGDNCPSVCCQVGVVGENEDWVMVHQVSNEPEARSLEVPGLNPYTAYRSQRPVQLDQNPFGFAYVIAPVVTTMPRPFRFRMHQVNIVGSSPPSQPSRKIQTLPAPPDMAPANVTCAPPARPACGYDGW
ncbi:unnamed protein product, partial [Tetraodon nigroviridis]